MKFVLFFLHLISLLFAGGSSVYAGNQFSVSPSIFIHTVEEEGKTNLITVDQDAPFMTSGTHPGSEKHYFINDGAENEQVNNDSPQKSKVPLVCNLRSKVQTYPLGLSYYRKSFITPPSFTGQVKHKYIVQRVLRI